MEIAGVWQGEYTYDYHSNKGELHQSIIPFSMILKTLWYSADFRGIFQIKGDLGRFISYGRIEGSILPDHISFVCYLVQSYQNNLQGNFVSFKSAHQQFIYRSSFLDPQYLTGNWVMGESSRKDTRIFLPGCSGTWWAEKWD